MTSLKLVVSLLARFLSLDMSRKMCGTPKKVPSRAQKLCMTSYCDYMFNAQFAIPLTKLVLVGWVTI